MTKTKQQQLNEIREKILAEDPAPDLRHGATQLVFGDGSPDAEVVFIGEAPGKSEDEQGLPFVGAAGRFLNEMLEMVGLRRSDVYITNIVKYRPPGNRDPFPDEKAAFLPYLQAQFEVIKPKLVITLGRHSLEVLIPGLKISQSHGQPKRIRIKNAEWRIMKAAAGDQDASTMQGAGEQRTESYMQYGEGVAQHATPQRAASGSGVASSAGQQADAFLVILPLFHPAAALYNGAMRATLIDDFKKIPQILAQAENLPPPAPSQLLPVPKTDQPSKPLKSGPAQGKLQFDI